jgi:hypothetical protein
MLSLSKKYDISDVGLRKMCRRMNIPVPQGGHWAKVQWGKHITIKKLPQDYTRKNNVTLHLRTEKGTSPRMFSIPRKALIEEIKNDPRLNLIVAEKLTKPDVLIKEAKKSLIIDKQNLRYQKGMVLSGSGTPRIYVAPVNIGRAIRFMDSLIKALRARGHNIVVEGYHTFALIYEQKLAIRLMEKVRQVKKDDRYARTEYLPTGILTFRIETFLHGEWQSGSQPLEKQLPRILAKLETEALREKEERRQIDERHREREEKQRLEEEHWKRVKKELSDFKQLIKQAKRLQTVTFLRQYLDVVEGGAKKDGTINDKFQRWIEWARAKADWYDPLINAKDELLSDIDKTRLKIMKKHTVYW